MFLILKLALRSKIWEIIKLKKKKKIIQSTYVECLLHARHCSKDTDQDISPYILVRKANSYI